jgi:tripartite-type tricarboxylate transporter receptor subunit TctC
MTAAMKIQRRQFPHLVAGVAALTVLLSTLILPPGHGAWSQSARTIRIIVPLAPGGGADILTRILAEHIGRTQRVGVVAENRAGAGSVIGSEAVSRSVPQFGSPAPELTVGCSRH